MEEEEGREETWEELNLILSEEASAQTRQMRQLQGPSWTIATEKVRQKNKETIFWELRHSIIASGENGPFSPTHFCLPSLPCWVVDGLLVHAITLKFTTAYSCYNSA